VLPQLIPPSPDAASLGKYGEIPVSTYTGIPNTEIPIYKIQSGKLSLPISLSYHAGGIKVEDIASSVGLGWSLNAGGTITRTVRGLPDEKATDGYFAFFPQNLSLTPQQLRQSADDLKDTQPDLFYFNFGPYSGKLIFDKTGECHVMPFQKFKIKPAIGPKKGATDNWEIVAEDGTIFTFAGKETTTTRNYCGLEATGIDNSSYTSSWYLTSIESAGKRDNITFQYGSQTIRHDVQTSKSKYWGLNGASNYEVSCRTELTTQSLIIRKILFTGGSVEIDPVRYLNGIPIIDNREDLKDGSKVDEIIISNSSGTIIKKVNLAYNYFSSGCIEEKCKRLKLESVTEQAHDGSTSKPYVFEYNTEQLPPRDSYDQDHWGFYNKRGNTELIPEFQDYNASTNKMQIYSGADKRPFFNAAQSCTLKRIFYPTGGSTKFDYQINEVVSEHLPNKTLDTPTIYAISGNGTTPNQSKSFTINGYYRPGQVVVAKYKITGCTATASDPDTDTKGEIVDVPEFNQNCPWVEIRKADGSSFAAFAYYQSETERTVKFYIPNGSYVLKGSNTKSGQSYYVDLSVETEIDSPNKFAGGLRVARVTSYDGFYPERDQIKEYTYTDTDGLSTGRLSNYPIYHYVTYTDVCQGTGQFVQVKVDAQYLVRTSNSNSTLGTDRGSFVGYGKVTEFHGTLGGNGKSEYFYTSLYSDPATLSDQNRNILPFGPPAISNEWKRGFLKKQIDYKYVIGPGERFKPVREVVNDYVVKGNAVIIYGIKVGYSKRTRYIYGSCNSYEGITADYTYNTTAGVAYVLDKSKEFIYDQQATSFTEIATSYTYNANLLVKQVETLFNTSEKSILKNKYPAEYVFSSGAANSMASALVAMVNTHHIHNAVIEKEIWEEKNGKTQLISGEINIYKPNGMDLDSVLQLQTQKPILSTDPSYYSSSISSDGKFTYNEDLYKSVAEFGLYNASGKLIEFSKKDGVPNLYIWGYNNTLPIAQVVNAKNNQAAATSFEENSNGNWQYTTVNSADAVTGKNSFTGQVSTFNLIDKGEYYITLWAKGSGNIAINGSSVTVTGNWTLYKKAISLSSPSIITVNTGNVIIDELRLFPATGQITTYTYEPLIGMNSSTDAANRTTYFEFDNFKRLQNIKDHKFNIVKNYKYNIAGRNPQAPTDNNNLNASFTVNGDRKASTVTTFTAQNISTGTTYYWDLGDGTIIKDGSSSLTHTYQNQGTYIVKLIVKQGLNYKSSSILLTMLAPPGPPPVVSNVIVSNVRSVFESSNPYSIPKQFILADVTVAASQGLSPYTYMWWGHKINDELSPFPSPRGSSSNASFTIKIPAVNFAAGEARKYEIKIWAVGSDGNASTTITKTIDAP
jgi:hypothetical protein